MVRIIWKFYFHFLIQQGYEVIIKDNTKEFLEKVREMAKKCITEELADTKRKLDSSIPVKTGKLKGSMMYQQEDLECQFGSNLDYAKFVFYGTDDTAPQSQYVDVSSNFQKRIQARFEQEAKKIR